jgi:uncharacterized caspase-like protein
MSERFNHGYALLIGVDENDVPAWALPDVRKDVGALQQVLTHPERCAYPPDNVQTLAGPDATRQGILDRLDWLSERVQADADATAVVYFTGHGWRSDAGEFYLIPRDVRQGQLSARALRAADLAAAIDALRPQRLLVLLDCCHAGGMGVKGEAALPEGFAAAALPPTLLMGGERSAAGPGAKGLGMLATGRGRAVLCSSTGEQRSYIRKDRAMSIFTFHLIEALTGHAQPQEGTSEVLVSDVMSHVYRRVPASARAEWGAEQTPDGLVSGNFPVALLLGGKGLSRGQSAPDPLELPAVEAGRPAYHAELHGSGAIAQGPGAVAAGERGVVIGGSVQGSIITTGDKNEVKR